MMKTPRFLLAACILLALALTFSCSDDDGDFLAKSLPEPEYCINFVDGTKREHFGVEKEQFCDKRDGNVYVKVKIGEQTWMAENLKYKMYNSQCYREYVKYDEEGEEICESPYGRLYDWESAMGACPEGWRLSNDDDWNTLRDFVGLSESGIKLKAASGWRDFSDHTNGNGTDDYGFSALPGGSCSADKKFQIDPGGEWWTTTARNEYGAFFWKIIPYIDSPLQRTYQSKGNMISVRCLLGDDGGASEPYREIELVESSHATPVTDKRDGIYKEYKAVTITTKRGNTNLGTKTWMAQNLNYAVEGSKCLFESDTTDREVVDENTPYCDTYGRLYNWNTAINACPKGWRLPSSDEWAALGRDVTKMRATSGWNNNANGTNEYGLALLPGGYALKSTAGDGHLIFFGNRNSAYWWTGSENETNNSNAYAVYTDLTALGNNDAYLNIGNGGNKSDRYISIRCVKE
ncbi:MAG: hypothetical protein LBQ87_01995 [Candidatus Fibromonas sp.]|jgi:uncharacterized protein (TIGR02145 family)|nr:hypothetical protein [Candidatus Fibromonas sp.]